MNCVAVVAVVAVLDVAAAAMAAANSPAEVRVLLLIEVFFLLLRFFDLDGFSLSLKRGG